MKCLMLSCLLTVSLLGQAAPLGEMAALLQGTNAPGAVVQEMPLGSVSADAVRAVCKTDLAIVNGGDLAANLQGGEVYPDDLAALFYKDKELVVVIVSQEELEALLELGLSHAAVSGDDRLDAAASAFDGFPQVSGLRLVYDVSCPPGERVCTLEPDCGAQEYYTLACTRDMALGGYGYPIQPAPAETGETLLSAMTAYFTGKTVDAPDSGRVTLIGTADDTIISSFPAGLFWAVVLFLVLLSLSTKYGRGAFAEDFQHKSIS